MPLSIAAAIEKRFPSDEALLEAMRWPYNSGKIWLALEPQSARISSVRKSLLEEKASEPTVTPIDLESLDVNHLLVIADKHNHYELGKSLSRKVSVKDVEMLMANVTIERPYTAAVALAGLAQLAPPGLFDWLRDFWTANPKLNGSVRNGICKPVRTFPPTTTLPWARKNLFHEEWHERILAEDVFETHSSLEDVPLMKSLIARGLEDDCGFAYQICNLAEAFYRFPNLGPVPELKRTFVEFRYSYGRSLVAKAIQITSPGRFREVFALECLWDCEPNSRLLGAKYVALDSQEARDRLKGLADDVWESEEVRTEARRRLQAG